VGGGIGFLGDVALGLEFDECLADRRETRVELAGQLSLYDAFAFMECPFENRQPDPSGDLGPQGVCGNLGELEVLRRMGGEERRHMIDHKICFAVPSIFGVPQNQRPRLILNAMI
jgi:hypothetical protein